MTPRKNFIALWLTIMGLFSTQAYALTCSEVRQLMFLYFKMHYTFDKFDDELATRTLDNFLKAWDPGKLYFTKNDIEEIRAKYSTNLDDMINQLDCSAVDYVINRYSKRFEERQKHLKVLLDRKYDFTKDEYMITDGKKLDYLKTSKELNERWRKRVKFQLLTLKNTISLEKSREKLRKRNELAAKRHQDLTQDRILSVFLNAFSMALDPHSSYMPADDLEDFRIRTRLSLEGIGASLRSDEGITTVASLVKGGAAAKGGLLKVADKIVGVAQGNGEVVDVIHMDLKDVVKLIRGARGTTVKLSILRDGHSQPIIIPIVREKIQLVDQQAASKLFKVNLKEGSKKKTLRIGVINLPSFYIDFEGKHKRLKNYRSSSQDTKRELAKLKKEGIDGLIVDLRSNGGGSLEESINMSGLFFDKGPVVQVKTPDGSTEAYADRDGQTYYKGPLVVMINRHSASASEIFAGAIQDYGRGIIVGDSHTFGKGTVQNLNDVAPTLGAIKVTVNQFYRPDGATTQLKGVSSDIKLPSLVDEFEIGEKFYDYALPFESIKRANHEQFNYVKPVIKQIKQISIARVASDKKFQEVFDAIEEYRKNDKERSRVSLKEKKESDKKKESDSEKKDASVASDESDSVFNLEKDVHLQETLRITGDYIQIMNSKKPGKMSFPSLAKKNKKQSP